MVLGEETIYEAKIKKLRIIGLSEMKDVDAHIIMSKPKKFVSIGMSVLKRFKITLQSDRMLIEEK